MTVLGWAASGPYHPAMAVDRRRAARASRKRARRMARLDHDLTATEWAALQAAWGGCAYCGSITGALQRDCVLAISRGGRYTIANVVPACRSCNASKCNAVVTGWLRRRRLDERHFLLRHLEIVAALRTRFHPAPIVGQDAPPTSARERPDDAMP